VPSHLAITPSCIGKGSIFWVSSGASHASVVWFLITRHGLPLKQRVRVVPSSSISTIRCL
jgi:hypothetical protein